MNFTREPIIETIITPKDGYKLLLKNTKGGHGEEYIVDAVEVVTFGNSIFYRSLERPKAFLLPVSDFEVVEQRETRIPLKNASIEKSVKIPSGSDRVVASTPDEDASSQEKKKDRRKSKKKKEAQAAKQENKTPPALPNVSAKEGAKPEKEVTTSSVLTKLFPPPSSLISESISRLKESEMQKAKSVENNIEEGDVTLAQSRQELIGSLEREEKQLDHIWKLEEETSEEETSRSEEEIREFFEITPPEPESESSDVEDSEEMGMRKKLKKDAQSIDQVEEPAAEPKESEIGPVSSSE